MSNKEKINKILFMHLSLKGYNGINKPADITDSHRLEDDLGADSLDLVELLMIYEEEFGVEISDDVAEAWVTVGDVYDYFGE